MKSDMTPHPKRQSKPASKQDKLLFSIVPEIPIQNRTIVVNNKDTRKLDSTSSAQAQQRALAIGGFLEHGPVARGQGAVDLHLRGDLLELDLGLFARVQAVQVTGGFFVFVVHEEEAWGFGHEGQGAHYDYGWGGIGKLHPQ